MSDLTEGELDSIERSLGGPQLVATSKSETCRMLTELRRRRAAQAARAEQVRAVAREAVLDVLPEAQEDATAIADRVVSQLSVPPPGHVCRNCRASTGCDCYDRSQELLRVERDRSASWESKCDDARAKVATLERRLAEGSPGHVCPVYALSPEDLDTLSELQSLAELSDWPRARSVIAQILAAHRAPGPRS